MVRKYVAGFDPAVYEGIKKVSPMRAEAYAKETRKQRRTRLRSDEIVTTRGIKRKRKKYHIGDRVMINVYDKYYNKVGTIDKDFKNGTYLVKFDDGKYWTYSSIEFEKV